MSDWEAVIGLEIHVQLRTETKMFCRCPNRYGDAPNTNVCSICLAHPGMLPVANREAVDQALRVGLALGCRIPAHSKWDRKNYFYPDSPKAYQISQYDEPLCAEGTFLAIGITRAHLEEDAAKTIHVGGGGGRIAGSEASIVDFNRCGTPLLEIVTDPDLRDGAEARRFLTMLRATVIATGASDCDLEKGSMRVDANVSVRRAGATEFGTKCELKNMNSFRFLERGINAEIRRQTALLEAGQPVRQATMHYDPASDELSVLRMKEEADDYRYFPEPDLVPVEPERALVERLRGELPELPADAIRARAEALGVEDAWAVVTTDRDPAYRGLVAGGVAEREAFNFAMNQPIPAGANLAELARVAKAAKGLTREALASAVAASADDGFAADDYLSQTAVSDTSELEPLVDAVLAGNPGQVEAYRGGKDGLLGFFVGQVMKETGGKANPKVVNELLREKLKAP
jgi:aspartyl-tRNA(Asn)/glutamyl-tRNA(Gln) amidotransferase subunit B